jgi:uncharacterized membrane protein
MTRPFSLAFKQKMIERLTGKEAVSALQLARQTGVRQYNLSQWLEEARSVPLVVRGNERTHPLNFAKSRRCAFQSSGMSIARMCLTIKSGC